MGLYFVLSEEMIKEGMPPLLRIFIWPTNVTKEQGRFQKRGP
jgi:guanylate kinase